MIDHDRADILTSDGDYYFLVNFFIPNYRGGSHFMETVRALWTALCVQHGVDRDMGGKGYSVAFEGVMAALNASDNETRNYLEEYLDILQAPLDWEE